jgi:hypothetical protein
MGTNNRIIINTQEDTLVSSSTALPLEIGIVVKAPRGPVGKPIKVTTESQLLSKFGTPTNAYPVLDAVRSFLKMYGGITISRLQFSDAVPAEVKLVNVTPAGWLTATPYVAGAKVMQAGSAYVCLLNHTSDVFADDLAADKWVLTELDLVRIIGNSYSDWENGFTLTLAEVGADALTVTLKDATAEVLEVLTVPVDVDGLVDEINLSSAYLIATKITGGTIDGEHAAFTFASGAVGSQFSAVQIIDAIETFDTPMIGRLDVLLAPGLMTEAYIITETIDAVPVTHNTVLNAALLLANNRDETIVLADFTANLDVSDVITALASEPSVSKLVFYHPGVKMRLGNGEVVVPASMAALFVHAAAATVSPWASPAGFSAAMAIPFVSSFLKVLKTSDVDLLYSSTDHQAVNPIIYDSSVGWVIDGQRTAAGSTEIRRSLAIERLVSEIKFKAASVSKKYQYKPNIQTTWDSWKLDMITYLNNIWSLGGITSFQTFMGLNTMTAEDIQAGRLIGVLRIVPTFTVEEITITINVKLSA